MHPGCGGAHMGAMIIRIDECATKMYPSPENKQTCTPCKYWTCGKRQTLHPKAIPICTYGFMLAGESNVSQDICTEQNDSMTVCSRLTLLDNPYGQQGMEHTGLVPSARVRMRTDSMRPTMSASVGCPVNTHAAYQRSGTACSVTAASLGAGALLASCGQNTWVLQCSKSASTSFDHTAYGGKLSLPAI